MQNEQRKLKREDLIMQRRGLNFCDPQQNYSTMNEDQIQAVENETDNIAPKIVALLPLNKNCDTKHLR